MNVKASFVGKGVRSYDFDAGTEHRFDKKDAR